MENSLWIEEIVSLVSKQWYTFIDLSVEFMNMSTPDECQPWLINCGASPKSRDSYGYWNMVPPQLNSRLGFINPGLTLAEIVWFTTLHRNRSCHRHHLFGIFDRKKPLVSSSGRKLLTWSFRLLFHEVAVFRPLIDQIHMVYMVSSIPHDGDFNIFGFIEIFPNMHGVSLIVISSYFHLPRTGILHHHALKVKLSVMPCAGHFSFRLSGEISNLRGRGKHPKCLPHSLGSRWITIGFVSKWAPERNLRGPHYSKSGLWSV